MSNANRFDYTADIEPIVGEAFSSSWNKESYYGETEVKILGRKKDVDYAIFDSTKTAELYFDKSKMSEVFFEKIKTLTGKLKCTIKGNEYVLFDLDKWYTRNENYDFKETTFSLYFKLI